MSSPLPYPLPTSWQLSAARRPRTLTLVFWAVVATGFLVLTVRSLLDAEVGIVLLYTLAFAAIGLGWGVSVDIAGGEHAMPEFINAVTLTDASTPPPDSWVHFFRARGPQQGLVVLFFATGLAASATLVWALIVAIAIGPGGWLFAVIPLLIGALIVLLAGSIGIALLFRQGSFGRRQLGITIGAHGLGYFYLDAADYYPWDDLVGLEATVSAVDRHTGDFTPGLKLTFRGKDEPDEWDLTWYHSHAWLIYTAVQFWHEHPEARTELSTTFAGQRIAAWHAAMVAMVPVRRPSIRPGRPFPRPGRQAAPPPTPSSPAGPRSPV